MKFTDSDIKILIDSGVNFVVSSDAHSTKRVCDVDECIKLIEKYKIPLERVKNIDKLLKLKAKA